MTRATRGSTPSPITLIKGSEEALVDRATRRLVGEVKSFAPEVEQVDFSAETYEEGELAAYASGSLFAEDKLLVVSDLDKMSDAFSREFESYLRSPAPQVWIVAKHRGGNRGQRILKALETAGAPTVDASPVKRDDDKVELVVQEVRDHDGVITREAAQNLVSALGGDLAELLASARQLVDDSGGEVTAQVVDTFHRGRVETRPYEVAQALADRDTTKALLLARQAFATQVPPVVIVAALATKFRLLAKVKIPGITASELKVPSWQVDRARREARAWSEESLGRAILAIADADAEVKGESRTPQGAIELCIIEIARLP